MSTHTDAGERLRDARKLAGLSQRHAAARLAERIGDCTERTIQRWERGESDGYFRHLDDIAAVYGTTRAALLGTDADATARVEALEAEVASMRGTIERLTRLLQDPEALDAATRRVTGQAPPDPAK